MTHIYRTLPQHLRGVIAPRVIDRMSALSGADCAYVAGRLGARYPEVWTFENAESSAPDTLTARCHAVGLDAVDIVMSMSRDTSETGVRILETIVGAEIVRALYCEPRKLNASKKKERPAPVEDTRVVLSVVPNPKRPGSQAYDDFKIWRVGATVAELRAAGLPARRVRSDVRKRQVVLSDREEGK